MRGRGCAAFSCTGFSITADVPSSATNGLYLLHTACTCICPPVCLFVRWLAKLQATLNVKQPVCVRPCLSRGQTTIAVAVLEVTSVPRRKACGVASTRATSPISLSVYFSLSSSILASN